jgi:hypothetical protein
MDPPYAIVAERQQTYFLNIFSAIARDHLEVQIVHYDPETGRHLERFTAFLSITNARQLAHNVCSGVAITRPEWRIEERGGSELPDGALESRLLSITYDPHRGAHAHNPFRILIEVGPGTRTATGGIGPADTGQSIFIRFTVDEFESICLEIAAFLTAHQGEIEEHRYREQLERYHNRRDRPDTTH